MFKKYQHIERYGTDEVEGIEVGTCYIFPKIDGTNSSVWLENNEIHAGSRKRELSLDKDNAGFFEHISHDENVRKYLEDHPTHRLFGEWLVPHSLKTYRDDAWRKFYVFDVIDTKNEGEENSIYSGYIPYEEYHDELEKYNIDYIPPIRIIENGNDEIISKTLDENHYLIKDDCGVGEGIVIKNYSFVNKYGRTTWAKIVRNEFKEVHHRVMGAPITDTGTVEERIINDYVTQSLVEKEFEKIREEKEGWSSKYIPILLSKVYHELINEEMWHILKKYKNPTINFARLNKFCIAKVKDVKNEIF